MSATLKCCEACGLNTPELPYHRPGCTFRATAPVPLKNIIARRVGREYSPLSPGAGFNIALASIEAYIRATDGQDA